MNIIDRNNATAKIAVSAKVRGLLETITSGCFACGQAYDDGDVDNYDELFDSATVDETALYEYIAELERNAAL